MILFNFVTITIILEEKVELAAFTLVFILYLRDLSEMIYDSL